MCAIANPCDQFLGDALGGTAPGWDAALDGAQVMQRVSFHGIAALLLSRGNAVLRGWPDDTLHALRAEAHLQSLWEASHHAAIAGVIDNLGRAGIASLVLKGTALAYALYDDPAARRRGDTDILVRHGDLAQARLVLEQSGFRRSADRALAQETWLGSNGDGFVHAIDLHWQVTGAPALNSVLPVADFFARSAPLPRLTPAAHAPCPVHLFLHNCINHAQHRRIGYLVEGTKVHAPYRLIWCHDVFLQAAAFTPAQWQRLARLALANGMGRMCLEDLEQAARVFPFAIPADISSALQSAPEENALSLYLTGEGIEHRFFADLRALPLAGRLRLIASHLFPARLHMQQRFPAKAHWPLALLYLLRLGLFARRMIWRRQ